MKEPHEEIMEDEEEEEEAHKDMGIPIESVKIVNTGGHVSFVKDFPPTIMDDSSSMSCWKEPTKNAPGSNTR